MIENLIETMPGWGYSKVDDRCFNHDGVIVDVGCLDWNWSKAFLGKKRVIGIDPQEKPIEGAELFRGFLGPFDGITRLYGEGHGAGIKSKDSESNLYDMISWKTLCSKFNIDKISVLKINIEGAEYPLLHSMTVSDFEKVDQIAVSFHDWMDSDQSALKYASIELLKKVGFKVESIYPQWGWYLAKK
tara:strand:+ start:401 stop:961 length:561 start_codon:yes stop_codon:yes gene_type:complete